MSPYREPSPPFEPRRRWGATPLARLRARSRKLARKAGRALLVAAIFLLVPPIRLLLGEDPYGF